MSPSTHEKAAPHQSGRGRPEAHQGDTTEEIEFQAVLHEGIYQRRLEWLHDGIGDLELSGVSCLLRAPRGGEARAILSRLPEHLTLPPLDEIVSTIRRKLMPWTRWHTELQPLFNDRYHEQLRCYSLGRKVTFTDTEATAHAALVDLMRKGGALR